MDRKKEIQRLKEVYSNMQDEELQKIARDAAAFTGVVKSVLQAELSSRGISWPAASAVEHPRPVMIRRFRDLPEATIAQSILESAGVESFLADDNLVRLDWFYSNLIGGLKLFVTEADADVARTMLDQATPQEFEVEGVGEYQQPHCPRCDSLDVSFDGLDKPSSYASLFINVPIPITNRGWKCHACGYSWLDNPESKALDG